MMSNFLIAIVVGTALAVIMLETLSGCGQTTYFQNRTWVTGECLFVPYTPTTGRW